MDHLKNIDELASNPGKEVFLAKSGWLEEADAEALEKTWASLGEQFDTFLAQFVARLGEPIITERSHKDLCNALYCEAMRLAAWRRNNGYSVLALAQHDRETPVFVPFGYRTAEA